MALCDEVFSELGLIVKARGLNGGIVVYTEYADCFPNLKVIFFDYNGDKVPSFIQSLKRISVQRLELVLEGVNSREDAEVLVNKKIWVPARTLGTLRTTVKDLSEQFLGYKIFDLLHGEVGTIVLLERYPAQCIASVRRMDREILIPLVENFILRVDCEAKILHMQLPEGLLSL